MATAVLVAGLGCRQLPPSEEGSDADSGCEALPPTDDTCADGTSTPGEYCLSASEVYEAEIQPGVPASMPAELLVGDFNGDGRADLRAERLTIFGGEALSTSDVIGAGEANVALELDAIPGVDVAWAYSVPPNESDPANIQPGHVQVRFFLGGADFPVLADDIIELNSESGTNLSLADMAAGDFDGDGNTDLAVSLVNEDGDSYQVELWQLTRATGLDFVAESVQSRLTGGGAPHVPVTAGKLGSDDLHDLIWDGQLFTGSPEGLEPAEQVNIPDTSGRYQFQTDIDCDGVNDLIAGDLQGAVIVSGSETAPYVTAQPRLVALGDTVIAEGWRPAAVGDLNGDDVPDLVFVSGAKTVVLFGGMESVEIETLHPWVAAAIVDINGDGITDLAGTFLDVEQQPGGIEVLMGAQ